MESGIPEEGGFSHVGLAQLASMGDRGLLREVTSGVKDRHPAQVD